MSCYPFSGRVLLRTQSCFFKSALAYLETRAQYLQTCSNCFGYVLFNIMTLIKFTLFFVSPLVTHFPQFFDSVFSKEYHCSYTHTVKSLPFCFLLHFLPCLSHNFTNLDIFCILPLFCSPISLILELSIII